MEFCLHGNWVLADDDTGREDRRMDGMGSGMQLSKGHSTKLRYKPPQTRNEGGFIHCYSPAAGLFAVFSILHLLPYFAVTVITLVWSVMM